MTTEHRDHRPADLDTLVRRALINPVAERRLGTFYPPAPADAILDARDARREVDGLVEDLRPLLDAGRVAMLSDAINDLEAAIRREFLSRLIALGVEALDVSDGLGERLRPTAIATPWLAEPEPDR